MPAKTIERLLCFVVLLWITFSNHIMLHKLLTLPADSVSKGIEKHDGMPANFITLLLCVFVWCSPVSVFNHRLLYKLLALPATFILKGSGKHYGAPVNFIKRPFACCCAPLNKLVQSQNVVKSDYSAFKFLFKRH